MVQYKLISKYGGKEISLYKDSLLLWEKSDDSPTLQGKRIKIIENKYQINHLITMYLNCFCD